MSSTQAGSETAHEMSGTSGFQARIEVVVLPVSDVDRAKAFYEGLGWRLDVDADGGDDRVVQFTPARLEHLDRLRLGGHPRRAGLDRQHPPGSTTSTRPARSFGPVAST